MAAKALLSRRTAWHHLHMTQEQQGRAAALFSKTSFQRAGLSLQHTYGNAASVLQRGLQPLLPRLLGRQTDAPGMQRFRAARRGCIVPDEASLTSAPKERCWLAFPEHTCTSPG